jgi:nitroreductase
MDAFEALESRASVRAFLPEEPPRDVVERLLAAAIRAPNHKLTEPWRFVVVRGDAKRRYAEIRRAHRAQKFADPAAPDAAAKIAKTFQEHLATPLFVFVIQRVALDPVRREEDYAAVMMATQNLMVAAVASGLGSYLRTGGIMDKPDVRALVGATEGERIVGIVSLGKPAAETPRTRRAPAVERTTWLE